MRSKAEMLQELKKMLQDVFAARLAGTSHPRMARAHGYVDGYMRALMECDQVTKHELLALVAAQRSRVFGPATSAEAEAQGEVTVATPVAGEEKVVATQAVPADQKVATGTVVAA